MTLKTIYALEEYPREGITSIFLAGPTPRPPKDGSAPTPSWRPEALRILHDLGYNGHVFIPEPRSGDWVKNYTGQVEWEEKGLERADCVVFWIPREMSTMPALTTNDEWGTWKESGKVVLGIPEGAPHTSYQKHYATKYGVPQFKTLDETLVGAVIRLNKLDPVTRTDGELAVPLHIWRTPAFQSWYGSLKAAGNVLVDARVLRTFYVGPKKDFLFGFVLWANVHITSENRNKTNEFYFARPDISTIVLHGPVDPENLMATEVILVREFRTPVNNPSGFVWEVAGGSSFKPGKDPLQVASEEVQEETGLTLDPTRFSFLEARQMVATLSVHRAHAFKAVLTPKEIAGVKATAGEVHGVAADTERTYTEVRTLGQIMDEKTVDWSMVGMILRALQA